MTAADARAGAQSFAAPSLFLIAGLVAAGQFAALAFSPAIPDAARALAVSASAVLLSATAFLGATAITQLVAGPLADRFGRRNLILIGLVLYLIGGAVSGVATSLDTLIWGRVVQAIGAAFALVAARAATRDLFEGPALQRAMATITLAFALAPAFAPLAGGVATQLGGFRAVFALTLALGLILLAFAAFCFPETHPQSQRSEGRRGSLWSAYGAVLKDETFRHSALVAGFANAAMTAFFVGAPILMIEHLALAPAEFGLYPPLAVIGFALGTLFVRSATAKLSPDQLVAIGAALMAIGAAALLIPALTIGPAVWPINVAMIVLVSGLGVLVPTVSAQALEAQGERAGSAAALFGVSQMAMGAIAATIVAAIEPHAPLISFQAVMAFCVFAIGLLIGARTNDRRATTHHE
jgi:DHA1 family bicyclomycin/chloramphenicol resistance-like MFS transporter